MSSVRTFVAGVAGAVKAVVVLILLGVGVLLWWLLPDRTPAVPVDPPATTLGAGGAEVVARQPSAPALCPQIDVSHCGCEGACSQCHHLCLECHCGDHIIDRGLKCQELAACEVGCSGDTSCDPPLDATGGGGATPCDLVDRLGADIDDIPTDAVSADLLAALGTDISELAGALDCG